MLVDNRWIKVQKDSVDLRNSQHIDDFYVITINNAVAINEDENIIPKKY